MHSLGKQGESAPAAASWDVTEMPSELQMNRLFLRMQRQGFPSPRAKGGGSPSHDSWGTTEGSLAGARQASPPHTWLGALTLLIPPLNQQAQEAAGISSSPQYRGGNRGPKRSGTVATEARSALLL